MTDRHGFPVRDSRTVHVGRIMALRADDVQMPGGKVSTREVVEQLGAVAIVPLDDDGRVTLVHQYRHPIGRRLWEIPAGLLDTADEDPLQTARRELEEEAGLAAVEWSLLVDVSPSPGLIDESVRVFLARGLTDVGRPHGPDDEEADLQIDRMPLDQAVRAALNGEIVNAPTVAGLLVTSAVQAGTAQPRPSDAPWPDRPTALWARR